MKKYILLILFLFQVIISSAQINFEDKLIYDNEANSIGELSDLELADLDNDGDLDVIVASRVGNKVAWYENTDGLGNFALMKEIDTNAEWVIKVYSADIDGDGYLDVVSNCWLGHEIVWYKNMNGEGIFVEQTAISTHSTARGHGVPMDIDNDGDMDFLSTTDSNLVWFENINGLGDFNSGTMISNTSAGFVELSDFDNDGDFDLLTRGISNDSVSWYENLGGQVNFGTQEVISIYGEGASSALAVDLDNDGDKDILTSIALEQRIHWYENIDGQGTFSPLTVVSSSTYAFEIDAVDIDSDGDVDILSQSGNTLAWFENMNSLGDFSVEQGLIGNLETPIVFTIGDLDNDDDIDVVSLGEDNSQISVKWYENEDGQASYFSNHIVSRRIDLGASSVFADMDQDGYPDLISPRDWYHNINGEGVFDFENGNRIGEEVLKIYRAIDFDNDLDIDLVGITQSYPRRIVYYENLGLGSDFEFHVLVTNITSQNSAYLLLDDLNGDNLNDIIVTNSSDFSYMYLNLGGIGSFGDGQLISTDVIHELIDIDNDGDKDLLLSTPSYESTVLWKENLDGNGTFGPDIVIDNDIWENGACSINRTGAIASDIDSDGDLDVIFYGYTTDECLYPVWFHFVFWYENLDGIGNFGNQNNIYFEQEDFSVNPLFLVSEDMDNDGDYDLFLGKYNHSYSNDYSSLHWFENIDGAGNFEIHINLAENHSQFLYAIKPYDIDSNGYMDLFYYDGITRWLKNLGNGLGIDEFNSSDFELFPNPTNEFITIKSNYEVTKLEIHDLTGKKLFSKENCNEIDVSFLSNGSYIIKITTNLGIKKALKFIKTN